MRRTEHAALDLATCPGCGAPAEVLERFDLGGLAHVRVRCVGRHWYLMPAAGVPGAQHPARPDQDTGRPSGARVTPAPGRPR